MQYFGRVPSLLDMSDKFAKLTAKDEGCERCPTP